MKGRTTRIILSFLIALALLASTFAVVGGPAPVAEASTSTFGASPVASQSFATLVDDEQAPILIGIAVSDSKIIVSIAGLPVKATSLSGVAIAVTPVRLLPLSITVSRSRLRQQTMSLNMSRRAADSLVLRPGWLPEVAFNPLLSKVVGPELRLSTS